MRFLWSDIYFAPVTIAPAIFRRPISVGKWRGEIATAAFIFFYFFLISQFLIISYNDDLVEDMTDICVYAALQNNYVQCMSLSFRY